jgi:hypothetical protein
VTATAQVVQRSTSIRKEHRRQRARLLRGDLPRPAHPRGEGLAERAVVLLGDHRSHPQRRAQRSAQRRELALEQGEPQVERDRRAGGQVAEHGPQLVAHLGPAGLGPPLQLVRGLRRLGSQQEQLGAKPRADPSGERLELW